MKLTAYSEEIAKKALEMGAIRLSPEKPFRWASGYYMPIYNDNRTLLGDAGTRRMIALAFKEILDDLGYDHLPGLKEFLYAALLGERLAYRNP